MRVVYGMIKMTKKHFLRVLAGIICSVSVLSCLSGCGGDAAVTDTDTNTDVVSDGAEQSPDGLIEVKSGIITPGSYYMNALEGSAPDPMIVEHEGKYYLYSTGGTKLSVRVSDNLLNWGDSKVIFELSQTNWGVNKCWAPEVYKYNGKFYLFFGGADSKGILRGSVAVCDTPDGTFKPIGTEPLLNFSYSIIDQTLFVDDDGRTYIFYSKDCSTNKINGKGVSQTYGVEVSNDFTHLIGDPVLISTPEYSWEMQSGNTTWNEGPVVFKENGKYYLLYSANYYAKSKYSIGYAVSDTVLAKYTKPANGCIVKGNDDTITGTGHCNIFRFEDEIYLVYHAHTVPPTNDKGRSLYIDKLIVGDDGTLYANGPTNTRQPLPDGVNGYYKYHGDVEITGKLTKDQDLGILTDEKIPKGFANHVTFADEDSVTLKFPEEQEFDLMWVYSTTVEDYQVATMDVVVNGKYIYNDVKFVNKGAAPIISFDKLPDGTKIKEITITFKKAEGSECSAIGEIIFSTKK